MDVSYLQPVIIRDTGTRAELLGSADPVGLSRAVEILSRASNVGVITGFLVPSGDGFAPETDGPPGAAALAASSPASALAAVVVTDEANRVVCEAAFSAYADLGHTGDRHRRTRSRSRREVGPRLPGVHRTARTEQERAVLLDAWARPVSGDRVPGRPGGDSGYVTDPDGPRGVWHVSGPTGVLAVLQM